MRTQVDVVVETGVAVLNATDEVALSMAELCDGDVILYAADGQHPALLAQREAGKRVTYISDNQIIRASGNDVVDAIRLDRDLSPAAHELPTDVLLAAISGAWALGLDTQLIHTGLETFGTVDTQTLVIA